MMVNFDMCLKHVLTYEGGFSQHPSDPGGATNFGITHAVLAEHRGHEVTVADVRALERGEVAEIYRQRYWNACRCDELPSGIDLAVFDCAVNQGNNRAAMLLQKAAGVAADGRIGPKTLAAVKDARLKALLVEFMAQRMNAYGMLQKLFKVFGLGWSRRLLATMAVAHAMLDDAPTSGRPKLVA